MGKVTIVGSYVVDLMSRTSRLPKPGETILGRTFKMGPGGKGGNQATAAAKCGSDVSYLTKVGNDVFGQEALHHFKSVGIDISTIIVDEQNETGTALIIVDNKSENSIVVTLGACGTISKEDVDNFEAKIASADIVLLQLETSLEAIEETVKLAAKHQKKVILNPAPYQQFPLVLLKNVDYITPNETEASEITGIEVTDEASALEAAKKMYALGVPNVIITLGSKGAFVYQGDQGQLISSYNVAVIDTTGAGDAFNGGLAHFLSEGYELEEAVKNSNAVAALSVTKVGTAPAMPSKADILQFLHENDLEGIV
ncbi:MAG: ribokinase [Solibacillus sp.]